MSKFKIEEDGEGKKSLVETSNWEYYNKELLDDFNNLINNFASVSNKLGQIECEIEGVRNDINNQIHKYLDKYDKLSF